MTRRRLGTGGARRIASCPTVDQAIGALSRTAYGHDVRTGQSLIEAQRAAVECVLWNLRVLAGWAPRDGVSMLRVLAGAVEIQNVEEHLVGPAGTGTPAPMRLGALATAWPRLARTTSAAELRVVLRTSPWGDPGGESLREVGLAMRLTLADRTIATVPPAARWAAGAAAQLLAREVVAGGRALPDGAVLPASRVLGAAATTCRTLSELRAAVPASARWALDTAAAPDGLWRAEARWWSQVERDALTLARSAIPGPDVLVGAAALLAADAWRVRAALESAARGGSSEAFDAVA